jgi:phosphoethanolamine N-methyltransferase
MQALLPFLPALGGKSVLRLETGANANTGDLAAVIGAHEGLKEHVTVSDLTAFLNGESGEQRKEFDFVVADSAFANLNDEDASKFVSKVLGALKKGGHFLFVESCSHSAGNRSPITFIDLTQSQVQQEQGFDLAFAKPNRSFDDSDSESRFSLLFKKIANENHHGFKTLREFMDHQQYSRNGVLRYEKIFGAGFVSTGGVDTTVPILDRLALKPGQRVLDVGCGIGGGDFLMAERHGAEVLAIDLSTNMVGIAFDRVAQHPDSKVYFEIGDICKQNYAANSFDVIYSRDTILHIADKRALFAQFREWLKPGGKIYITDYCSGPREQWTDEYTKYVAGRGYHLLTVPEYGAIFTELGFKNVEAEDKTDLFCESLRKELKVMDEIKEEFVKEFTQADFDYLVQGWTRKLGEKNQRWGHFYCEK